MVASRATRAHMSWCRVRNCTTIVFLLTAGCPVEHSFMTTRESSRPTRPRSASLEGNSQKCVTTAVSRLTTTAVILVVVPVVFVVPSCLLRQRPCHPTQCFYRQPAVIIALLGWRWRQLSWSHADATRSVGQSNPCVCMCVYDFLLLPPTPRTYPIFLRSCCCRNRQACCACWGFVSSLSRLSAR